MSFTTYSIQVWRQELVDHIIDTLDQSDISYTQNGEQIQLADVSKSSMVEHMMSARELPNGKQDDVYHALMISMWADPAIQSRATRDTIQYSMEASTAR